MQPWWSYLCTSGNNTRTCGDNTRTCGDNSRSSCNNTRVRRGYYWTEPCIWVLWYIVWILLDRAFDY